MTKAQDIPPELVDRMVAHFRRVEELRVEKRMGNPPSGSLSEEARDIAADHVLSEAPVQKAFDVLLGVRK